MTSMPMTNQVPPGEAPVLPTTPPQAVSKALLPWLAIAALLMVEYGLFAETVRRELAWFVPTGYDQAVYLDHTYHVYDKMVTEGLWAGLREAHHQQGANGAVFPFAAALLCLVLGLSRLTVLTVNFLLYAAFQCSLAGTLRWYTGRWSVAWFGLGLLLAAASPFFWAGGLLDARLDFGAFSLYGMFVCAVIRSRLFAARRWALVVGLAAIALTVFRHITAVYLVGIFGMCLVYFTGRLVWGERRSAARQLSGLVVAGSIWAAAPLLVLVAKFNALWKYYFVNFQTSGGDREVRAAEFGCLTLGDHLSYYGRSLVRDHAGKPFLVLAAVGILAALVLLLALRRRAPQGLLGPRVHPGSLVMFLCVSLLLPHAILTYSISKSPIVGNILVVPLLWLALLPLAGVMRRGRVASNPWATRAMVGLAVVAVSTSVVLFTQRQCHPQCGRQEAEDAPTVLAFHEDLWHHSREAGLKTPIVSFDCFHHLLFLPGANAFTYEQHRTLLNATQAMPANGVMAMNDAAIGQALESSHFVVLTTGATRASLLYPFHQQMETQRSGLRGYCERELIHVQSYHMLDSTVDLYMRPWVAFHGASGGWITSRGCTLAGRGEVLRQAPTIEMRGKIDVGSLRHVPGVSVALQRESGSVRVPATFDVTGDDYRLRFTLPADQLATGPVEIQVKFDHYFVPRDIGMNQDIRQLVARAPSEVKASR
jgi:hypothetical protein